MPMRVSLVLLLLLTASPTSAGEYTFTEIARDQPGRTLYFLSGSLNDAGDVAFLAFDESSAVSLYLAPRDGAPVPVVSNVPLLGSARTRINGARQIAYPSQEASGLAIRLWSQAGGSAIALDASGQVASISTGGFDLNDAGEIAARVLFDDGDEGIVRANGGSVTRVFSAPDAEVGVSSVPALNEAGQVAFRVLDLASGLDTIYRGSAEPPTAVLDATTPPFDCNPGEPTGCFGARVDLDDEGRVLVNGFFDGGGELLDEGYLIQGDTLVSVVDTAAHPFEFLRDAGVLNDRGDVAFLAQETDQGVFAYALYTGPDPTTDRLIGPGDELLGATVAQLSPYSFSLNEAGEILFAAQLTGGVSVLVRAPEAGSLGAAVGAIAALRRLRRR